MMRIAIEATDGPLFLCPRDADSMQACNYYRAVLPARMTGGTVRRVTVGRSIRNAFSFGGKD